MDLTSLGSAADPTLVRKLTGVLNIDDTVLGRSAFRWAGAKHRKRCALTEMTHDGSHLSDEWRALQAQLPVELELVSRDKRPHDLMVLTGGIPPCIVAHTDTTMRVVVLAADIERCNGDPNQLLALILDAIPRWSLRWA